MVCSLTCSIPSASWQQLPTEKSRNQGTCMVLNVFILSNCGHQRFWPSWHNRFGRFRLNLDSRTVYYILECMPLVLHVHHFAPLNSLLSFSWNGLVNRRYGGGDIRHVQHHYSHLCRSHHERLERFRERTEACFEKWTSWMTCIFCWSTFYQRPRGAEQKEILL